ncbi:MAG: UPF0058 family protein [Haloarculaceae archaeon]
MRKTSLIQIHALLVAVRQELEKQHDVPDDVFAEYDSMGIKPIHIHMNKGPHKQAVFALLDGVRGLTWVEQHLQDGQTFPERRALPAN